jgi:hypothetical protein
METDKTYEDDARSTPAKNGAARYDHEPDPYWERLAAAVDAVNSGQEITQAVVDRLALWEPARAKRVFLRLRDRYLSDWRVTEKCVALYRALRVYHIIRLAYMGGLDLENGCVRRGVKRTEDLRCL